MFNAVLVIIILYTIGVIAVIVAIAYLLDEIVKLKKKVLQLEDKIATIGSTFTMLNITRHE